MNRRVLVVDDSEVTRAILARTLRTAGFEVLEARDGAEGAMAALREQPAVVVTDLEMPTMDGFPLLRLLKADPASTHIPVLILTSHGEAASRFWSLRTGADAYLTKDSHPGQLVEIVARLVEEAEAVPRPAGLADSMDLQALGPVEVLARVARHLDASLLQATILNTLLERGMAAEDFHEAASGALETLAQVVDAQFLAVAVAEADSGMVQILLQDPVGRADVEALGERLAGRLRLAPGSEVETRISGEPGDLPVELERTVWLPLSVREASGVLAFLPRDPHELAASSGALVGGLTGHLALVLDNARLSQRLRELSTLDGLTRQLNHRVIYDRLTAELERARRYRSPMSVVLCDFDHFKEINDTYGHLAGDAVLREGAGVLRRCLRGTDLLGRYGGEEFLAVLPEVDLAGARKDAERLRQGLANLTVRLPDGVEIRVTASFGVASRDEMASSESGDVLVSLADRRLYEAKAAGRNLVRP
ncbi:MAG TPA: diguanylate cyclase [Thermoanaerobaculia bacterium]|nr:diguanylate cyclase [Thermoanaerobaculia bacterium]